MRPLICFLLRLWLARVWLESGLTKLGDPAWMEGGEAVRSYWARALVVPEPPARPAIKFGWYRRLIEALLDRQAYGGVARALVAANLLTGVALLLGLQTRRAAVLGLLQNMAFALAGSSGDNPPMLVAQAILAMSDPAEAERIGLGLLRAGER